MTAPIFIAEPDTPEWLERRKCGITASEAAAAIGADPYIDKLTLYRRKRGETEDVEENELMQWGKFIEPGIVRQWEYHNDRQMRAYPMAVYGPPEHEFLLVTPDAEIEEGHRAELKSMRRFIFKKIV